MSLIPMATLSEIAQWRREQIRIDDSQTYKRCRVRLRGQGIVLRDQVEGVAIRTKKQQLCTAGQLLVAEIDAKVGGFGIVPEFLEGAVVSSHYFLYDLDRERVEPAYLGWYLRTDSFQDQVRAQGSTNYASIRPADVLEYVVPLPGLDAQRKVASALDGAWNLLGEIEAQESILNAKVEALPGAILETLCEDEPRVPLGQICRDIRGGAWGDPPVDDGVVVLRAGNIARDGTLTLRDIAIRSLPPHVVEAQQLRDGDLVLTKSNSLDLVGSAALFEDPLSDSRPYVAGNFMVRLRLDPSQYAPSFLWHWLRTASARRYFQGVAAGTSPSLQNLTHPKVAALPVPLPTLPRQLEILSQLQIVMRDLPVADLRKDSPFHKLASLRDASLRIAFA